MKESISNAFIFGIFITFAFLLLIIFTAAINYSRANKVKNKILNHISAYAELHTEVDAEGDPEPIDLYDPELLETIESELAEIGYRGNYGGWNANESCENYRKKKEGSIDENEYSENETLLNPNSNYKYCVFSYKTARGYYYRVVTFMYFDIPIINTTLEFPTFGETRVIYDLGKV